MSKSTTSKARRTTSRKVKATRKKRGELPPSAGSARAKYGEHGYDVRKPLGEILDARLEELGRTRTWLAEKAGCKASPSTIYRVFSNKPDSGAMRSDLLMDLLARVGLTFAAVPDFKARQ